MKLIHKLLPLAIGFVAIGAQASSTITFSGLGGTTDPSDGVVSFYAGAPANFFDTYVDDALTPGNNYLLSGVADGTGKSPASGYDAFIGADKTGVKFGTVTLDIASDWNLPSAGVNTRLYLAAFLGGVEVGSTFLDVVDTIYHQLTVSAANGFDSVRIYDNLNTFSLSEPFHIDNFVYSDYVQVCTDNCNSVPEPGSLLLATLGLAGLAAIRRRKGV